MSATNTIVDPVRTLLDADPTLLATTDPFESPRLAREQRIQEIRRAQRKLNRVARTLTATSVTRPAYRVWWGPCTRCGYIWLGRWLTLDPPIHCSRCHSNAWQTVPWRKSDRTLDDPPKLEWARWKARQDREKRDARDKRRGTYVERVSPAPPPPETRIDPAMVIASPTIPPEPRTFADELITAREIMLAVPFPAPPKAGGPSVPFPPPPRFASLSEKLKEVTNVSRPDESIPTMEPAAPSDDTDICLSATEPDDPDAAAAPGDRTEDQT
jgi:hypothetical protein